MGTLYYEIKIEKAKKDHYKIRRDTSLSAELIKSIQLSNLYKKYQHLANFTFTTNSGNSIFETIQS